LRLPQWRPRSWGTAGSSHQGRQFPGRADHARAGASLPKPSFILRVGGSSDGATTLLSDRVFVASVAYAYPSKCSRPAPRDQKPAAEKAASAEREDAAALAVHVAVVSPGPAARAGLIAFALRQPSPSLAGAWCRPSIVWEVDLDTSTVHAGGAFSVLCQILGQEMRKENAVIGARAHAFN